MPTVRVGVGVGVVGPGAGRQVVCGGVVAPLVDWYQTSCLMVPSAHSDSWPHDLLALGAQTGWVCSTHCGCVTDVGVPPELSGSPSAGLSDSSCSDLASLRNDPPCGFTITVGGGAGFPPAGTAALAYVDVVLNSKIVSAATARRAFRVNWSHSNHR